MAQRYLQEVFSLFHNYTPSFKEAGGRRLYSEEDMFRMEKITLLKSLSLPLSEIESLLDALSIRQILEAHQKCLEGKMIELQESMNNTTSLLHFHELEGEIHWDTLLRLCRVISLDLSSGRLILMLRSFEVLNARLPKLESNDAVTREWIRLITRIEDCIHKGIQPQSSEGAAIAEEIERLSELTFAGDTALMNKFWELRKDPASAKQGLVPVRKEVIQFVEECLIPLEGVKQK
ncbi:MerR family transcriptional regulator [Paenibacillus sp. UMB4589-SE434]|uniref:MerR family transcriptional regulator n=1 Tax=Paenibacillus sp. UMB4589-SE434 TaxID=3046314 RepID=UPI00254CA299|nr:MerR family transcriptional regulator [Paenibacillus sp. UMB4589-SE434]MDK8182389.1 MerR family transcriptional regulator [Paenibacillus sp. UMB4589-SE434]